MYKPIDAHFEPMPFIPRSNSILHKHHCYLHFLPVFGLPGVQSFRFQQQFLVEDVHDLLKPHLLLLLLPLPLRPSNFQSLLLLQAGLLFQLPPFLCKEIGKGGIHFLISKELCLYKRYDWLFKYLRIPLRRDPT